MTNIVQSKRALSTLQKSILMSRLDSRSFALSIVFSLEVVVLTQFVCTIHQNVKLMLHGARLHDHTSSDDSPFLSYHCLARLTCNPPLPDCYLGKCNFCPGTDLLNEQIFAVFDASTIDTITYKQWAAVDHSTLETVNQHSYDFVETFCEKLEAL